MQFCPGLPRVQQLLQGLAVMVLHRRRPNVAHSQPQPGQLVLLCGHLAVAQNDDLIQGQQRCQLRMVTESLKLGDVVRTVSLSTTQRIKPEAPRSS